MSMTHDPARLQRARLPLLLLLTALAACHPAQPRINDVPDPLAARDSVRAVPPRVRTGTARETVEKRVDQKRPPATLVAADLSWCTVSDDQYARIQVGDLARCTWNPSTPVR